VEYLTGSSCVVSLGIATADHRVVAIEVSLSVTSTKDVL
jgi:hypothetical protein